MVLWHSSQSIRQDDAALLTNLVNFGLAAVTLEVDLVRTPCFLKYGGCPVEISGSGLRVLSLEKR